MNTYYFKRLLTTTLLLPLVFIFVTKANAGRNDSISVFVSILPQVDFVQRIGGPRLQVTPLVLPGQSPATFAPTPKQMAGLSRADLYFRIGVPFEKNLIPKLQNSTETLKIIDLRTGIEPIRDNHHGGHAHADDMDPHIWLDPALVSRMAHTIRDALIAIDPVNETTYRANCSRFQTELDELHQRLHTELEQFNGRKIYVFHPAYAYFCRAYGLEQHPIAPDGKIPGARHLANLIDQAKSDGVKYIFIQPQFSRKTAEAIAGPIGAKLLELDPLAENYMENMTAIGRNISLALTLQPDTP